MAVPRQINYVGNQTVDNSEMVNQKITNQTGELASLNTTNKSNIVSAINEVLDKVSPLDPVPTENSTRGVESGGIWDAIRFASAKVGETMYWPVSDKETREVHSNNPFVFTWHGQDISVTTQDGHVDTYISKDIPDGWHALDGNAELDAADYPELAAFLPDNVTTNRKIWLPYAQQKIIKVKY